MSDVPLFTRFRYWLGLNVILEVLYFVIGERPQFCDLADNCPLDNQEATE